MNEEKVFPDPTPVVRLEVLIKDGPKRISLQLDEKSAINAAEQIQEIANAGKDNKTHYEDENISIWLIGSLKWESEEQYQYHLKKRLEKEAKDS